MIDLRSDTVTKPSAAMRAAMAAAEVGDDVFGEDPTVLRLEETVAQRLGKEAASFVPSGTMSNQIGLLTHCGPGDEFICETGCHVYNYEQGAYAQFGGLAARTVPGEYGVWKLEQLVDLIRPENDHCVRTRLLIMENTHNRGAGRVQPYETVQEICGWARARGLATHLDGARLWNAVIATGRKETEWCQHFDTVSVCFSKGLGAPVGSALAGSKSAITKARRLRKAFGGGMRQAGVLAAAAIYALDNHFARLAEDHAHARLLGDAIRQTPGLELCPQSIDSNIVIFAVDPKLGTAAEFCQRLKEQGVLMITVAPNLVRAVTHLDVDTTAIHRAGEAVPRAAR
jgi:threonine aldolase